MSETDVALELFLAWLNGTHGRRFLIARFGDEEAMALDGAVRLATEVRPLLGPAENEAWLEAREQLEHQLSQALSGAYALWLPAGANLPAGEPLLSEFIENVRRAAFRLGPHERSYIPLPIKLYLRKNSDEGGVVSVSGGLNPYWARFTDLVRGTYDLDSTQLHRLPESEDHLEGLIERIVERSKQINAGQRAGIETIDVWTIQRLGGDGLVTIVGVPPGETEDAGLSVRRNFRRLLAEAVPRLRERDADLRALVVLGYYARIEQETATTAMRGYDPQLYAGIDFVCLVSDGLVKPLIQPPLAVLTQNAPTG